MATDVTIEIDEQITQKTPTSDESHNGYDTLVLSGASTKAFLTLGAIQYAWDNFLLKELNTYIGTSSGAMICYLLTIGYTPIEMIVYICTHQLLEKMQHFNIVAMMQGRGASSFNSLHEHLEKMTISKIGYLPTLNDIKKTFNKTLICITHNLTNECTEYLSYKTHPDIPCLTAIRMSANLPLIFERYEYGGCYYIDGGISDNFAIQLGDNLGTRVLGIYLVVNPHKRQSSMEETTLEYIYNLIYIPIVQTITAKIKNVSESCKIIRLEHDKLIFFTFDIPSRIKLELFCSGYQQSRKFLDQI